MASLEMLWKLPPADTRLDDGEVQVWCVNLNQPEREQDLFNTLPGNEQRRANQFRIEHIRRYHITARATLRQLLGRQLNVEPSSLEFQYGPHGKPELAASFKGCLHFNISHSGALGLIAMTKVAPVGVDVEHIRAFDSDVEIVRRFFTSNETARFESLPESQRPLAFFSLWTRKEAWIKAMGSGIAESLTRVETTFVPGEPPQFLQVGNDPQEASYWSLMPLGPAVGFTGALAIRASNIRIACWQFPH
jgi:4'-phosphopantetheinyl transferase